MEELLRRVSELQGKNLLAIRVLLILNVGFYNICSGLPYEKTRLAEQHQKEVAHLQAEMTAQVEAHKTEVSQFTSALSAREEEKIRLEGEVKKIKEAAAALETRATIAELEDAENAGLIESLRRDIIKIDTTLTSKLNLFL